MTSRSVNKKKDMLKVKHRSPPSSGDKRPKIKGSLTMKKKRHAPKRTKTPKKPKTSKPRVKQAKDKHKPKKHAQSAGKPGYLIKGDRVHYRTRSGIVNSMPKHHVGMVRNWKLSKVSSL